MAETETQQALVVEIYKPKNSFTLAETTIEPRKRVGFQGPPFSGKTTAGLTFPNPVVMSYDKKLEAHIGRSDVIEVPFWNPKFVDSIVQRDGVKSPPNRKDATLVWLSTEGQKLTPNQTLLVDGGTAVQTAFHMQYALNPKLTRDGSEDGFAEWRQKTIYFGELVMALKSLSCNVVYICHETPDRDKKGELNGQIRPMLTGQFGDELASHFTDWFRCMTIPKPSPEKWDAFKAAFLLDDTMAKEWVASTPKEHATIYVWQTQSDAIVKCGTSSMFNAPKYVLAHYNTFERYKRTTN